MSDRRAIAMQADDRDPTVPTLSLILGYGPMLPILGAGAAVWLAPAPWPIMATSLCVLWAGGILIFLAGVRRGLAFRTPGGARATQMVTMIWLFVLGLGAFVAQAATMAFTFLILGYLSIAILDPIAARHEEAPAHFARLRPPQMALGLVGLIAVLAYHLVTPRAAMIG